MIFDAPDGFKIPIYELHEIMEDFYVDICIKQKKTPGSKSIVIKTQERNASAIYAARIRLLKIKDLDVLDQFVVANIPESYDLLQSGSDFNQEKVTRFDSSTDSGSDDEFNAGLLKIKDLDQFVAANIPDSYDLLQSGSDFNQEKVTRFDSSTDSGSDDEFNANQYPNSPTSPLVSNRLPVFIAITSKFNKLTC